MLSQRTKPTPDERVVRWWQQQKLSDLYLSVVTLAEIRAGVEQLAMGNRRSHLEMWLEQDVPHAFAGRILPVTAEVADQTGRLVATGRQRGMEPELADALIAATALVHGCQIATLNERHFQWFGTRLVAFG